MKKLFATFAFVIAVSLVFAFPACAKELKIGYIDSDRILNQSQDYKDAKQLLEQEEREYEKKARQMEMDLKNLQEEIEAQSLMWSEEKKIEKQQEAQNLYLRYQQYLQDIWGQTGKLYQRNLDLSKPIVDKINQVISRIGETEGFDLIFDASAGQLVFAKPDYDLTDRVLEELAKK